MKLTHSHLTHLGTLLGYKDLEKGLCAGFTGMWMQAVFAKDEKTFYKRLDFIATYGNDLSKLVEDIKKIQETQNKNLNEHDLLVLDVLSFFDGIQLYLHSWNNRSYFPDSRFVPQEELDAIFPLVKSIALEQNDLEILLDKDYTFTEESLIQFFDELAKLSSQTPSPTPISLTSIIIQYA